MNQNDEVVTVNLQIKDVSPKPVANTQTITSKDHYLFLMTKEEVKAVLEITEKEFISYEHELAHNILRRMQQFVASNE